MNRSAIYITQDGVLPDLKTEESSGSVFAENILLFKIIDDLRVQLYHRNRECTAVHGLLSQAQEEKSALLEEKAALQGQVEEGIRKGWQLEEFKHMLFGHKSERFTDYSSDITSATQQLLGDIFNSDDIEAVIAASRARAAAIQELADKQPKGNRHDKVHRAHKGRRKINNSLKVITKTVDYEGDKTGLKSCGKKVVIIYDYVPGTIVKSETIYPKYINQEGKIFKAPAEPNIIEKGTVSNRMLAYMHLEKFVYYNPYYRQLQKLQRLGVSFAASTVNGWRRSATRK